MIQRYIRNKLAEHIPDLEWTIDYHTSNEEFGVVRYDGGDPTTMTDLENYYLNYQVEIRLYDKAKAEILAHKIYKLINKTFDVVDRFADETIYIQYIKAQTPPIRIGVEDDLMIYTINFSSLVYYDNC